MEEDPSEYEEKLYNEGDWALAHVAQGGCGNIQNPPGPDLCNVPQASARWLN